MVDDFEQMLRDLEGAPPESLKQKEGVVVDENKLTGGMTGEEVSERISPVKVSSPTRIRLDKEYRRDKKVDKLPMIGGTYGMYACDHEVCKKLFNDRTVGSQKPMWAVDALVKLRDRGVCQVCHEEVSRKGEVVRRKPRIEGGEFDEYNCITLCDNCAKVWPYRKNFYLSRSEEVDMCKQYLYTLRRRGWGHASKGVRHLSDKGMQRYRELQDRLVLAQKRLEMTTEQIMQMQIELRAESDKDTLERLKKMLKESKREDNIECSDNEGDRWE